jgi:hypothetical protein
VRRCLPRPNRSTLRIVSYNTNGLGAGSISAKAADVSRLCVCLGADVVLLQETHTDTTKLASIEAAFQAEWSSGPTAALRGKGAVAAALLHPPPLMGVRLPAKLPRPPLLLPPLIMNYPPLRAAAPGVGARPPAPPSCCAAARSPQMAATS